MIQIHFTFYILENFGKNMNKVVNQGYFFTKHKLQKLLILMPNLICFSFWSVKTQCCLSQNYFNKIGDVNEFETKNKVSKMKSLNVWRCSAFEVEISLPEFGRRQKRDRRFWIEIRIFKLDRYYSKFYSILEK